MEKDKNIFFHKVGQLTYIGVCQLLVGTRY